MFGLLTRLGSWAKLSSFRKDKDQPRTKSSTSSRMGPRSKFSFSTWKGGKSPSTLDCSSSMESQSSKAQRILGSERSLNIDLPLRYGKITSRPPSSMAMSIAEPTLEEAIINSWDEDVRNAPRLCPKPSSSVLGQIHEEETPRSAVNGRRLKKESSISSFRSEHDGIRSTQKTPSMSVRGQSLREHATSTGQNSRSYLHRPSMPNLGTNDNQQYRSSNLVGTEGQPVMRKSSRSTLSRLFSRSGKDDAELGSREPNTLSRLGRSHSQPRTISSPTLKPPMLTEPNLSVVVESPRVSYESKGNDRDVEVQVDDTRVSRTSSALTHDNGPRDSQSFIETQLQPQYEDVLREPLECSRSSDGECGTVNNGASFAQRMRDQTSKTKARPTKQDMTTDPYHVARGNVRSPHWDMQSTSSSRRTSNSVFSDSDLRNQSVLSMSSDEDSDDTNPDSRAKLRRRSKNSDKVVDNSTSRVNDPMARRISPPNNQRLTTIQDDEMLSIPASSKIYHSASTSKRFPRTQITNNNSSAMMPEVQMTTNGRIMQVTKQEQELLSALRKKRAYMQDQMLKQYNDSLKIVEVPKRKRKDSLTKQSLPTLSSSTMIVHKNEPRTAQTVRLKSKSSIDMKPETAIATSIHISKATLPKQAHRSKTCMVQPVAVRSIEEDDLAEVDPAPDLSAFLNYGNLSFNEGSPIEEEPQTSTTHHDLYSGIPSAHRRRTSTSTDVSLPMQKHSGEFTNVTVDPLDDEQDVLDMYASDDEGDMINEKSVSVDVEDWPISFRTLARLSAVGGSSRATSRGREGIARERWDDNEAGMAF